MTSSTGLRQFEVSFDATGLFDDSAAFGEGELRQAAENYTDFFVYVPGWHATKSSARRMTKRLFANLSEQLGGRRSEVAAVSVDWPFFLFPEDDPGSSMPTESNGNQLAASLGLAFPDAQFELDELGDLLDRKPASLTELRRFHSLATALVRAPSQALEDSGPAAAFSANTVALFAYAASMSKTVHVDETDADPTGALWSGAREVLRIVSYYEMSNRAGVIGRNKLGPLLRRLGSAPGHPRIHLIGHSYGARMAAYALAGLDHDDTADPAVPWRTPVKSLTMLQGSLSHFAFADQRPSDHSAHGALASVAARVDGPLISTYSSHDRFLGWWYPTACMLNHEDSQSAEELAYRWGAMGHDGLQGLVPKDIEVGPCGFEYDFGPGRQYRMDASKIIATNQSAMCGAHSDIVRPEVVWALVAASGGPGKPD